MKTTLETALRRFLSIFAVIFFVSGPFLAAFASPHPNCIEVHRPPIATGDSSFGVWSKYHSLDDKVSYLRSTFPKGAKDFFTVSQLSTWILKQSPGQQTQWIQAIGQAYRSVPKKDPNPFASSHIGGRRLLDFISVRIENYQASFRQKIIKEGLSPREAYARFLSKQSELYGSQYSAKEVELVIEVIQKELKALEKVYVGAPLKVFLAGSFPNGKANLLSSDIDLSLSNAGAVKWLQSWPMKLAEKFKAAGVKSNLELSFSVEPMSFYGGINPVVVEISASQVNLHIFPEAKVEQSGTSLRAGEAQVYPWGSSFTTFSQVL